MSIPKIIHYCWFGKNQLPELAKRCIESWKKYCPDYEIREWNESNTDLSSCKYIKEAYDAKKYAFVSDVVRLQVIYKYGGIYLDTDVEILRPLDDLLDQRGFFGFEYSMPTPYGRKIYVSTGLGFGGESGNNIIKAMLDDYSDISFIKPNGEYDMTACPPRNTSRLASLGLKIDNSDQIIDGVHFYPNEYFGALDYITKKIHKTEHTYTLHHYSGSWIDKKHRPDFRIRLQCTKFGMLLWRIKDHLSHTNSYVKAFRNALRIFVLRLAKRADIKSGGHLLLDRNTKIRIHKRGHLSFGRRVESDGRCTIIVESKAQLSIGNNVYFNEGAMLSCLDKITIGDGTLFGPNVKLFDNDHRFSKSEGVSRKHSTAPITIGEKCWIASNVTILKGVTIGNHCVIGAGCVITEDIPDNTKITLLQQKQIMSIDDRQLSR